MTHEIVLALKVDTQQKQEQLWLGHKMEVEFALRGRKNSLYLAQTRPLGAFWCEFGKISAEGWTDAIWALSWALTAENISERKKQEQRAAGIFDKLSKLDGMNVAARYVSIQIWEMYLGCCRGRDPEHAAQALRDYSHLLILPFGKYTPEMFHWKRENPIITVWNGLKDAKLEIWYPKQGQVRHVPN